MNSIMNTKIGILGGGQLAMMMTEAAFKLGITDVTVLDPTPKCPASYVGAKQIIGSFTSEENILELAKQVDVITFDIESVDEFALMRAEKLTKVRPNPRCLEIIKDKFKQNCYLRNLGVPIPKFYEMDDISQKQDLIIVKTRKGGYDGKGVWFMKPDEIHEFKEKYGIKDHELFFEEYVQLDKELAIIGYIDHDNKVELYPIVETNQHEGICVSTICPTHLDKDVRNEINDIARKIISSFSSKGIFAIEFFLTNDGKVLVNEVSPRVHNSGHYTIEGSKCSQFEQHIRSLLGLPNINGHSAYYIKMYNILGTGSEIDYNEMFTKKNLHWYHKRPKEEKTFKKNRKIGHYSEITTIYNSPHPIIYIIMGSSSDLPILRPAIDLLKSYKIPIKVDVVSAHRSPEWMFKFGRNIESWCGEVIIAGAGGAAHLPGMIASLTTVPVIGVPIPTKHHQGMDSLLSIVEMPDGVPVATVGIGKAKNAAILALKMLSVTDSIDDISRKNKDKVKNQRANLLQTIDF